MRPSDGTESAWRARNQARPAKPARTLLFLCTGNFYRSRFAEIYFNALAERLGLAWRAVSRGLAIERGIHNVGPMSAHARERLHAHGIPHETYLRPPRQATADDLERADHIIALKEAEHRPLVEERFPSWADRVEYWEIHDVDCAVPRDTLACLEREVHALATRLANARPQVP